MKTENEFAKQFEELRIWQEARVQAVSIYRVFEPGSIGERDYGFRDQIQRAGVSVMNNIAEGFERRTPADFGRFLDTAKGSCGELRIMLYLAEDLDYLSSDRALELRHRAIGTSKGIEALARSVRSTK